MGLLIVLGALIFLMFVAYRGYSVILFAPIAALGAVLLTDPSLVPPLFSSVFMEKMVGFVKNYFPVFMLGAVFGKVIELSGFSKSIVAAVIGVLGRERAVLSIVVVCAILTYGGVSLFVVVFAVYPFAAEMFRQGDIPKRLIPCTIALGAFSFTMDALPGTPQIQNIIPTTFFNTTTWAAPVLGLIGSVFVFGVGLAYIENRRRAARKRGEGYGTELLNEPEPFEEQELPNRGSPSRRWSWWASRTLCSRIWCLGLTARSTKSHSAATRSLRRLVQWQPYGQSRARCSLAY